jgi:hypothetical protein
VRRLRNSFEVSREKSVEFYVTRPAEKQTAFGLGDEGLASERKDEK